MSNLPGIKILGLGYISTLMVLMFLAIPVRAAQWQPASDPCTTHENETTFAEPQPANTASYRTLHTAAVSELSPVVNALVFRRFPELQSKDLRVRTFASNSDYFRTRFSISRFFLFRRMRYFIEANPELLKRNVPPAGVCGILAHELSHISQMSRHNRLHLLGLVRLLSRGYTARFERAADLDAIEKGFAPGLKQYRQWVYQNVPTLKLKAKKRNYFSPSEIDAILDGLARHPELGLYWKQHVPLTEAEIRSQAR